MKVKKDVHGLYVRTGGYVFRPVKSTSSYEIAHAMNSREDGTSQFVEDQILRAAHVGGTPFARVRTRELDYVEWWHSHGAYCAPHRQSFECWKPAVLVIEEVT